ncbi:hypothetical protein C8F04DRAFT_1192889 [Mycena alexandri]|uniref:Uncharacterized protein n=1 Tax=Mycena alexandri TaxID=1745969 RepID=A0AAD6SCZ4_9AGAR|nr:hypothetical protein C8F04DRAFT_1192889 [Mycena alexandri]
MSRANVPPKRYLSPTPPILSASVPLEPYLSPSPPISSASVPLKRYPSPHNGYLVPLVPTLHAVGHLSPHSGYLVPFVPALHAVGHPSPHSGYLVSFVPTLHAVGHTSPPPPVLWETGVPQVPPNPRRVSIVRHWPRGDLVVGTSRWLGSVYRRGRGAGGCATRTSGGDGSGACSGRAEPGFLLFIFPSWSGGGSSVVVAMSQGGFPIPAALGADQIWAWRGFHRSARELQLCLVAT